VKRNFWGLKKIQKPAYSYGECAWFVFYGIASISYRVFICVRILLFLNNRLPDEFFILVPLLAFSAIVVWVFVPIVKFLQYLAIGAELARNRFRAIASTFGILCLIVVSLGLIRMPDHWRIEGIVEPVDLAVVHAKSDGFVTSFLQSGTEISPGGLPLIEAVNPELTAEKNILISERKSLEVKQRLAEMKEIAAAQIYEEQIEALDEKIARVEFELDSLNIGPPLPGTWVAPDIEHIKGTYLNRGQSVGFVANLDDVVIRATAGQNVAAMLVEQAMKQVEMRVKGRPELQFTGEIIQIFPAGLEMLPSDALGYTAGGSMPVISRDQRGTRTAEKFFEIRIKPNMNGQDRLLTGQRVIARIQMSPKPLIAQWWQSARQLFQRRFHI
jgi:putative peptide zinc metalloprotease protein